MCVCVYVCMYDMYVCANDRTYTQTSSQALRLNDVLMSMYVHDMYVCVYVCMYDMYVYVCMYDMYEMCVCVICMYVCMCVCVYVCVYVLM